MGVRRSFVYVNMDLHIAIDFVILGQIETHLSFLQTIVSTSKDILMPDTMSWVKGDLPISFSILLIRFLHLNIFLRMLNVLPTTTSISINIPP